MGGAWERQIRSAHAVLLSLLKTYGKSLDKESILTLATETEGILNSRPLTTEIISNLASGIPHSSSNILTMKSKVVMLPPENFSWPDLCCRKRWRRAQHIANEILPRWGKKLLQSLQTCNKWQSRKRKFCVGDVVLLCQNEVGQNQQPMSKVTEVFKDSSGYVRSVNMKVGKTNTSDQSNITLERSVAKIVLLCESE